VVLNESVGGRVFARLRRRVGIGGASLASTKGSASERRPGEPLPGQGPTVTQKIGP
jgi:hypothetical protein